MRWSTRITIKAQAWFCRLSGFQCGVDENWRYADMLHVTSLRSCVCLDAVDCPHLKGGGWTHFRHSENLSFAPILNPKFECGLSIPIGSMYGIYANIGGILMVNVTIYTIHGSYGIWAVYPMNQPINYNHVLGEKYHPISRWPSKSRKTWRCWRGGIEPLTCIQWSERWING